MKKILFPVFAALVAATASAATDLAATIRQDWPWSTKVYIDVTMPEGTNDLALVATFASGGEIKTFDIASGCPGVEGRTSCVAGGDCHVTWDPVASGFTGEMKNLQISAKAVSANERAWLVLDCDTGDYRYVALGDEEKDANGWPWATSADVHTYRRRYMVFRRIPAGKFQIGYTSEELAYLNGLRTSGNAVSDVPTKREVEFTSDYYIGIHQVTIGQNARWYEPRQADYFFTQGIASKAQAGDWSARGYSCFLRGSNTVDGINWPTTLFRVKPGSNIDQLRAKFGNRFMFDLPTAAQWMHAARPDADDLWYDTPDYGGGTTSDGLDKIKLIVNTIARGYRTQAECKAQGYGDEGPYGTVHVGRFQPNSFGIYDVISNRRELVLDGWSNVATMVSESIDPVGPSLTGNMKRVVLNSYANDGLANPVNFLPGRIYSADNDHAPAANDEATFRFVIHLNPPQSFGGKWE